VDVSSCCAWIGEKKELTVTFDVKNDAWRQDLVPAVDHPDNPSRIDLSD
jgi:hypothetical protein